MIVYFAGIQTALPFSAFTFWLSIAVVCWSAGMYFIFWLCKHIHLAKNNETWRRSLFPSEILVCAFLIILFVLINQHILAWSKKKKKALKLLKVLVLLKYTAYIRKTDACRYFSYIPHLVKLINLVDISSLNIFQWG